MLRPQRLVAGPPAPPGCSSLPQDAAQTRGRGGRADDPLDVRRPVAMIEPMELIPFAVAALFSLLGLGCLLLVALSLPGTWILLGLAVGIELLDGHYLTGADPVTFGWVAIGVCAGLAGIGEALEAAAGAAGVKAGGGSKRGMVGAIVGGILGAIVLTPVIPIPVIGTLLGALIGTFCGALVAERTRPDTDGLSHQLKAAGGATLGRLLGTIAKTTIAVCVWVALSVLAFWP